MIQRRDEVDTFDTIPFRVIIVSRDDGVLVSVWLFSDAIIDDHAPHHLTGFDEYTVSLSTTVFTCLAFF